jgi:uncharacterized repeat protein (TIGR02543 family)
LQNDSEGGIQVNKKLSKWANLALVLGMTVGMFGLSIPAGNSVKAGVAEPDPQISAGYQHSEWLRSNGTVMVWGYGDFGQLGDGQTISQSKPVRTGLENITAVAAGFTHTLWLKSDGTVWASGYNQFGQVGNNSTVNQAEPVQVIGLSGVTALAAGQNHSVALKSDGTVWVWGGNNSYQLGDGTSSSTKSAVPKQVPGLSDVKEITAGSNNVIVRKNDGTYWAWGDGNKGQLGYDSIDSPNTPYQLTAVSNVKSIASGEDHMLWLKTDGTVWATGLNTNGQLGDGSTTQRKTPVQVSGLSDVKAISAAGFSMALKTDGTVWSWGENNKGQLGDGTTTDRLTPVQVSGLSDIVAIDAGGDDGRGYAMALKSDGTVWAWGLNGNGQVGDKTSTDRSTPVQVTELIPPVYESSAVSNGSKTVTLTFDEDLFNHTADASSLKAAVTLAADGTNFAALGASDSVSLVGKTLVVTLNAQLTGTGNKLKVVANALEDVFGNVLTTEVTTDAVVGAILHTVTYNDNGSTGGTVPVDSQTYLKNTTVSIKSNVGSLTKTGFDFGGWNTKADGMGLSYATGGMFPLPLMMGDDDIILYAIWTKKVALFDPISDETAAPLTAGYSSGSQDTKTIKVNKIEPFVLTGLTAALSGASAGDFVVTQPLDLLLTPVKGSTTFTVKAKDGLKEGTYNATVTVSASYFNATTMSLKTDSVTFAVKQVVAANNIMKGDVNGDGKVTPADALFITKYVNGLITLTDEQKQILDMNDDDVVNAEDTKIIMNIYLGVK